MQIGFDLVGIDEIEGSMVTHGERFLERVFTARERGDSEGSPSALAARFAAKEATMKALGRSDEAISWQSVEVVIDRCGQPTLELHDGAADLAGAQRLTDLSLSIVSGRRLAGAIVVAREGG